MKPYLRSMIKYRDFFSNKKKCLNKFSWVINKIKIKNKIRYDKREFIKKLCGEFSLFIGLNVMNAHTFKLITH